METYKCDACGKTKPTYEFGDSDCIPCDIAYHQAMVKELKERLKDQSRAYQHYHTLASMFGG